MAKSNKDAGKPARPQARLPKGMRDIGAAELRQQQDMLATIRKVYERYGFEPLETPTFEYTDALGKFLPDSDRPNEGVFSFQDEDEQWLSLRYDLTAPLARYVAQNRQSLAMPFRRYAVGSVYRNEKPGPGRFRQFTQFDADTVGSDSIAADAEMCMLAADTLEALGINRKDFVVKVGSRKVLDGLLESAGLSGTENAARRLLVLRAVDKIDRLGPNAVADLLTRGRKDESGDFTPGVGLEEKQRDAIIDFCVMNFMSATLNDNWVPVETFDSNGDDFVFDFGGRQGTLDVSKMLGQWAAWFEKSEIGSEGVAELAQLNSLVRTAGYGTMRIEISSSVVRGLEYYTGPVFEAELLFNRMNDDGMTKRFGSVGGGGRYDGLVERFGGPPVPATGFSIGVSRLQAALALLNKDKPSTALGPVVVTVMDKEQLPRYQGFVQTLRNADIAAELYLGNPKKFGRQLEYADKRGSPCVVIQGTNEREKGEVILKDLIEGAKAASAIKDNAEWKAARPAQVTVPEADLVAAVRDILARYAS